MWRNLRYTGIQDEHTDLGAPDGENHGVLRDVNPFAPGDSTRFMLWSQRGDFFRLHQIRPIAEFDLVEGHAHNRVPDDSIGHCIVVQLEASDAKATDSSGAGRC